MDLIKLKEWLIPISTFITLITASIGIWVSLKDFRLKNRAERRLAESSELESDIKLLKLFTEIVSIAHGRGGYQASEKAIKSLMKPETLKQLGINSSNLSTILSESLVNIPVGKAEQDAAISAIWALGKKYKTLMPVALQALESINEFKPEITNLYLINLKKAYEKAISSNQKDNYLQ